MSLAVLVKWVILGLVLVVAWKRGIWTALLFLLLGIFLLYYL